MAIVETCLTDKGTWELWHEPENDRNEWKHLVLTIPPKAADQTRHRKQQKKKFHLGWNGERLARSRDVGILKQHYPHMFAWLETTLETIAPEMIE